MQELPKVRFYSTKLKGIYRNFQAKKHFLNENTRMALTTVIDKEGEIKDEYYIQDINNGYKLIAI